MTITEEIGKKVTLKPLREGKVAVVTGGSRGIGAAIAKELARNGAYVAINYQSNTESAAAVVKAIEEGWHIFYAIKADVSDGNGIQHFIGAVKERYGKIDIIVNNAGITTDRTFRKMSEDDWNEVIDVNLNSVYRTTSAVINEMLTAKIRPYHQYQFNHRTSWWIWSN